MNRSTNVTETEKIRRRIILQNLLALLPPISLGLSILYIIYTVAHYYALPPHIVRLMSPCAFLTALYFIIQYGYLRFLKRHPLKASYIFGRTQGALFLTGCILLLNCWLMMWLTQDAQQTTNFMIVQMGFGAVLSEFSVFMALTSISVLSWLSLMLSYCQSQSLVHFIFAMVATTALSVIMFASRRTYSFLFAQLQVRETERQAELLNNSKMAALGEMASGIAHEVNNPLMIIIAKLTQLQQSQKKGQIDQEQIKESLSVVENTASRITKIIRGLQSFSRQSKNDPLISVFLPDLIEDTLSFCRELLKSKQITLISYEIPAVSVNCRPAEISQVILNLLNNAVDAVENENEKKVRVQCLVLKDKLQIAVSDSGSGVPFDLEHKIMEPFFTTKPVGRGSGLGLSISKGIAESHGGRLFIDRKRSDTTFVLEIPL